MNRVLKLQALALRAVSLWGKSGRQSRAAKHQRRRFYEAAWKEAASYLNAEFNVLSKDVFSIRTRDACTRVFLNYTALDDPVSLRIAGNKPLVHQLLAKHGVPTPAHISFSLATLSEAHEFLASHPVCVVKPAAGTGGGQGVTTGIRTARQLRQAAIIAAGFHADLILEEQVAGANVRLLFLDGQLLDAIERRPPGVTGDGHSTVSQLIRQLNERRLHVGFSAAQSIVRHDQDMRQTLETQGFRLRSVPKSRQRVQLKTVINDNMAEENISVVDSLHPAVIDVARCAADAVGLRLAGVDIVTPDMSQSLEAAQGIVLEVNSTPGFHFHYARNGGRTPIAIPILAACLNCFVDPDAWRHNKALLPKQLCDTTSTL